MRKGKKISLEDYLQFFLSNKQFDFTVDLLYQLIRMHGFKSIYKVPKKVLKDAVDTIDLENLSRSTLKEKSERSSSAFLNMEDIVADLKRLDWQECCITSIQTLTAKSHLQAAADDSKKKKRKRVNSSVAIDAVSSNAAFV